VVTGRCAGESGDGLPQADAHDDGHADNGVISAVEHRRVCQERGRLDQCEGGDPQEGGRSRVSRVFRGRCTKYVVAPVSIQPVAMNLPNGRAIRPESIWLTGHARGSGGAPFADSCWRPGAQQSPFFGNPAALPGRGDSVERSGRTGSWMLGRTCDPLPRRKLHRSSHQMCCCSGCCVESTLF
jgi:hypothetical protein